MKEKWRVWRRLLCLSMAGHSGSPRSPPTRAGGPTAGALVAGAGNGDMGRRGDRWVGGDGRGDGRGGCGEEQRSFGGQAGVWVLSLSAAITTIRVSPLCQAPPPGVLSEVLGISRRRALGSKYPASIKC